jgi:hypothetical protein
MNVSEVLGHLKRLGQLYGALLEEENRRLSAYLDGDLERVDAGRIHEEHNIGEVRRIHAALRDEFSAVPLEEVTGELPEADRLDLERGLSVLDEAMAELRAAIRRNRRYIQNSLAYSQAVLQSMFAEHPRYDGDGFVQAEGRSLRRGMRV